MELQNMYVPCSKLILEECGAAVLAVNPKTVENYIRRVEAARKVFFVGVGRVLLSLEAIGKRYAHLGIDTVIVGQITEPSITEKDVLIVGSGSGETAIPLAIAKKARQIGAAVIHIGSNPISSMKMYEDLFVRIPVESRGKAEDEIRSKQPMTSLFEQSLLLFGDITALMIIREKHLDLKQLWEFHANLE